MVMNDRPFKKIKRDLNDFLSFPSEIDGGCRDVSFRSTVQRFLNTHARPTFTPSLFPSLLTWQILFKIGDVLVGDGVDSSPAVVALDVVEEDVTRSRFVYCDQCRVVGWSNHPVCAKRYHFIIRAGSSSVEEYQKLCSRCGFLVQLQDLRCQSCSYEITMEDVEDWLYMQLEDTSHLLHGVVHSNGYGHLLRVNGREGGSKVLTGCDIMDFWDRLCNSLSVRKISVMDVSRKYGMEYRLLHAITKSSSWYTEWGYRFGSGTYGLTRESYDASVKALSSVPLSALLFQGRRPRSQLQAVISFYRSLSDTDLLTLKDLFSFTMDLTRTLHNPLRPGLHRQGSHGGGVMSAVLCAWTRQDVGLVHQAMTKVLLATAMADDQVWVTRHSLKAALCKTASFELLDYCLKHLPGLAAGAGLVVESRCNPDSSFVEFRLQPPTGRPDSSTLTEELVIRDLKFLYDTLLHPHTMSGYSPPAVRQLVSRSASTLLDCKHFVKDYTPAAAAALSSTARLWCEAELSESSTDDPLPPPELLSLPPNATVADLKQEAGWAFQSVYPVFRRFQAEELLGYGRVDDSMTLSLLVGSGGSVRVRGRSPGSQSLARFRMERGTDTWTVDCPCGTADDDGERMLACDGCGVWSHTRCAGIGAADAIPAKFICRRCIQGFAGGGTPVVSNGCSVNCGTNCRVEVVSTSTPLLLPAASLEKF